MTKTDTNSDAPVDALTLAVENIRWKGDPPRPKTRWRRATGLAVVASVCIGTAAASAGNGPRLAPPGCITKTVQPGGNVWSIAQEAGVTLDVIAKLNPQVPNLRLVFAGDEIAVSCPGPKNTPADPTLPAPIVVLNEMQSVKTQIIDPVVLVNVSKWLPEREPSGIMSWRSVVAYLYQSGFRGEDLVTMAATTPGESGRRAYDSPGYTDGDLHLQSATWGPSTSPWMIRTLKADTGTGRRRDIVWLKADLKNAAKAAFELYTEAKARGADPFTPWSAYLVKAHVQWMDEARAAAREIGVI